VRVEGYGPIVRDPALRELRTARGEPPQPLGVIVSHTLKLDPELPLLADADSRVVLLTSDPRAELPPTSAAVSYVRADGLPAQLRELRERHDVRSIVCEGGPMLAGSLLADGLVDELFLSISPLLLGGPEPLTIVTGPPMASALELRSLLEHESHLYARYVATESR
jgi:riboflavin biosynthesis pyrimidine reductase